MAATLKELKEKAERFSSQYYRHSIAGVVQAAYDLGKADAKPKPKPPPAKRSKGSRVAGEHGPEIVAFQDGEPAPEQDAPVE